MANISKYFKNKRNRTLDDLEKELTSHEMHSIIYSFDVTIKKEADGKIHFEYVNLNPFLKAIIKTKIKTRRELMGLPEDYIMVPVFDCYIGNKPCYKCLNISEIPELSKYLKSK